MNQPPHCLLAIPTREIHTRVEVLRARFVERSSMNRPECFLMAVLALLLIEVFYRGATQ